MKHILCIHLLNWPIDSLARRLRRQSPDSQRHQGGIDATKAISAPSVPSINNHQSTPPLLIVHAVANRQIIVAAGADALRLGIRPGQTLTEARIHSADLLVHAWQPADDARGIESLGRYLMRFTPVVATTTCDATDLFSDSSSSAADSSDAKSAGRSGSLPAAIVYLDLTGCEHLFGGLEALLRTIAQTLARLRIFARLAVAPNPAAAYALTFSPGGNIPVTQSASLRDLLAPLPIDCLRLDDHSLHLLQQLGIETIGQLLKLPRNQLASRFGRAVLQRIGQALGEIAEPLVPLPCGRPIEGKMDFEGPASQSEAMEEAFRRVLTPMIEECYRRGQGFRELRITLPRPDEPPLSFSLELSRPTRNPRLLLNLFRCAMEQQQQRGLGKSSATRSSRRDASGKGLHPRMQPPPRPSGVTIFSDTPNPLPASPKGEEKESTPPPWGRLGGGEHCRAKSPNVRENIGLPGCPRILSRSQPSPKGEGEKGPMDRSLRYISQPNFDAAFLGLQLSATRLDALGQQQANMVETDEEAGMEQWQETLDRLRIRFGPDSIVQAQLVESHLPEHAFKLAPAGEPRRPSAAEPQPKHFSPRSRTEEHGVHPTHPPCDSVRLRGEIFLGGTMEDRGFHKSSIDHRPLTLLPTPQEIRVTVSPSDDRDGRPIQFGDEDGFHRVVHWVGPERISGEWWEGRNKTRDYFDVEDEAGRRQWIFRVHETGRWFLHGVFA